MRKRSQSRIAKDAPILDRIRDIKADHPLWGYRRVWAYMRYRDGILLGKNRVHRLMLENNLLVSSKSLLKAKRYTTRPKPRAKVPNQYWGMDMTKIKLNGWGWIYIHVVLDWYTKEIIGQHVSTTSKSDDWLAALNMAVSRRFPDGIREHKGKPKLITDNGCQPTATSFMKACSALRIRQIFTTWNNPKGNADTERVFRTLKEDLVWPNEWSLPFDFDRDFQSWVVAYNTDFPHQSLRYKTPSQFFDDFIKNRAHRKELSSQKLSLIFA